MRNGAEVKKIWLEGPYNFKNIMCCIELSNQKIQFNTHKSYRWDVTWFQQKNKNYSLVN